MLLVGLSRKAQLPVLLVAPVGSLVGVARSLSCCRHLWWGRPGSACCRTLDGTSFSRCQNIWFVWRLSSSVLLPPSLWFLLDFWCVRANLCFLFAVSCGFSAAPLSTVQMIGCFQLFRSFVAHECSMSALRFVGCLGRLYKRKQAR